ncbi:MAG: hypothetical protein HS108_05015 [Planctomycetes bacterium]|jgi:hypothetical protein|nr:hypothetical protein [Planctomycetota bacterium]MCL4729280.1 hypothetical protein [Planctomycetota bacterium]
MRFALLIAPLVLAAGCATAPAPFPARSPQGAEPYQITVRALGPAVVTPDGFEARFEFHVVSPLDLRRNALVQELRQVTTLTLADGRTRTRELSLVEAFRLHLWRIDDNGLYHYGLPPGMRDRHAMAGMLDYPPEVVQIRIERQVFAYVANVAGADFSAGGFAHLPENEDGSTISRVGPNFNADHQAAHETRGRVWHSGTATGVVYRMAWNLRREAQGSPTFFVDHGGGSGAVVPPEVRYAASR